MLADPQGIRRAMEAAATAMGATIVQSNFHHFSPLGVSGVVVIMESHLTIHSWPEHQYAAIDIFTCGDIEMQKAVDYLIEQLSAQQHSLQEIKRGLIGKP